MGSVSLNIGEGTARFSRPSRFSSVSHLLMLLSVLLTNLFALYSFSSSPPPPPLHLPSPSSPTFDPSISGELAAFLRRHPLPLGKDSHTGITEMVSSLPISCFSSSLLRPLSLYMNYTLASPCPPPPPPLPLSCHPLPKRRCFSTSPPKPGLLPLPSSLWAPVHPRLLSWSPFSCKSFSCLPPSFNLAHPAQRLLFIKSPGNHHFLADDVLRFSKGGVRVAVDFSLGTGTFAAVMAEKGVTVVTLSADADAPYNEFIAARGLFPFLLGMDQRFPFFDGVFDMVHAGTELDGGGGSPEKMEFLMFDVDRILRAGGLLWVDNFRCETEEKKRDFTRLIQRFGYRKLRWVVGERVEGGTAGKKPEVYLSAVLEKPVRV